MEILATHRFGRPSPHDPDWYTLHTELKHEDIASLISATRVSVTAAFTRLRQDGLIEGSRGRYRVNIRALATVTEGTDEMAT